ncbi:MAG: GFA family protein [Paracoccus sp. (in: a-proteobacteria)]|nr:GFA family protein [Paracoccus sp. (in: a-proteobacteria)]
MTDTPITTGTCRCGQVRITAQGAPLITFACHCTGCQRMTASAFSISALYPEAAVTIEGETIPGGMRGELHHHCCPSCLSWLFTTAPVMGPMVNIRSTMLEAGPAQKPPFIECWTTEKRPWAETGARHSYPGFPPPEDFARLMAEFGQGRA